jgi:hypothetical protein
MLASRLLRDAANSNSGANQRRGRREPMTTRTIRQGAYLAAALALTAVAFDRFGSTHGVEAQGIRIPIVQTPILIAPIQIAPLKPAPIDGFESAVRQTAAIAEGLVTEIQYEYSEEQGPWTRVVLSNVRAIAGDVPPTVEIRQFGGPLPNGALMVAAELPVFVLGKEYIVFLRNTEWNVSPVVGDYALRVDQVDYAEVVVNSDGQPVRQVGPAGFDFGPALFEPFEREGAAPRSITGSLLAAPIPPLDRASFTTSLRSTLDAQALQVSGSFIGKPAGGFQWRAQQAIRSPLDAAPVETPDTGEPELDNSEPKN